MDTGDLLALAGTVLLLASALLLDARALHRRAARLLAHERETRGELQRLARRVRRLEEDVEPEQHDAGEERIRRIGFRPPDP